MSRTRIPATGLILAATIVSLALSCANRGEELEQSNGIRGEYLGQAKPDTTPVMFAPQIVSTGLNEGCCTFAPDGRELFCHIVYRKEHDLRVSLVGAKETSDVWSELEMLDYSGGPFQDMYPFLSYDTHVGLASFRPPG